LVPVLVLEYQYLVVWDSVTCIVVERALQQRRAFLKKKKRRIKNAGRKKNLARGGEHLPYRSHLVQLIS